MLVGGEAMDVEVEVDGGAEVEVEADVEEVLQAGTTIRSAATTPAPSAAHVRCSPLCTIPRRDTGASSRAESWLHHALRTYPNGWSKVRP